jgi:hypothetical protein
MNEFVFGAVVELAERTPTTPEYENIRVFGGMNIHICQFGCHLSTKITQDST